MGFLKFLKRTPLVRKDDKPDFLENIRYRAELDRKVGARQKLTKEEREWLDTTPRFNELYSWPCYQRDVVQLQPKQTYRLRLSRISVTRKLDFVIPVLGVASLCKGNFTVEGALLDRQQRETGKKQTKILGVMLRDEKPIYECFFESEKGLLSVYYECRWFDPKMKLYKQMTSYNAFFGLAMEKEVVSENKLIYRCKSPLRDGRPFDALVFSLEWEAVDGTKPR